MIDKALLEKNSIDLKEFSLFLNSLDIQVAQYRNKNGTIFDLEKELVTIKDVFNGKVIINDYIDLLDLADGLHLGQEDIERLYSNKKEAINKIKLEYPDRILGISTHNIYEVLEANILNLDYIGLGAYRSTTTKKDALVKGEELLKIANESKHNVALIGGVKLNDDFKKYPRIYYKVVGSDLINEFIYKYEKS